MRQKTALKIRAHQAPSYSEAFRDFKSSSPTAREMLDVYAGVIERELAVPAGAG